MAGKAGGTLNYAESGSFNDFNPWTVSATNMGVYNQAFSRLTYKDGDGKVVADLAETWEMAQDGLSYTVKMQQNAKWQDGKPCTADDFVTMYKYTKDDTLLQNATIKKMQGLLAPITNVEATDQYTLKFTFGNPVPYFADILDYWFAIRIDDPTDVSFTKKPPVATGPFIIKKWVQNQYVQLDKFSDFYRDGEPLLDEFMFKRLEKAETLMPNLQSGTIDGIQVTSMSDVDPLKADSKYRVDIIGSAGSIFNMLVNVMKPPFDKQEVRQALSYSLDREGMIKSAFFGVSDPITSPFYDPASLAYRQDLVMAHTFDLDKAKQLLQQAGVTDLSMTTNVTPTWPQMKLFSLIWQSDLAKIGVKLTVNEVEIAKFYDIGGDAHLLGNDVHPWLNARTTRDPAIFWSTQTNYRGGDSNKFGYKNDQLEQLVAQGAVETDEAKRKDIYQQTNQIVVDSCHVIQVATNPRVWAFNTSVEGVHYDLSGNLFIDTAWLNK